MKDLALKASWGVAILVTSFVAGSHVAQAQTFDHLTCVNVSKDDRFARMPPPLTLTSQQVEFLTNNNCKPTGGGQIARAKEICYPTSKSPSNPPNGTDLAGENLLCYRVKCAQNGGGRTEHTVTDQFGSGTVFANQRPVTKKLCVPAFLGGPSPTPTTSATPSPTPTAGPTQTPVPTGTAAPTPTTSPTSTPAPTATATPAPTPTGAPTATATPAPTPTGAPTATPTPTETAAPTPTPSPTETAAPTATPTATPGSASLAFVDPVPNLLR